MSTVMSSAIEEVLSAIQAQLGSLAERLTQLEERVAATGKTEAAPVVAVQPEPKAVPQPEAAPQSPRAEAAPKAAEPVASPDKAESSAESITQEDVLAIAGALAAYFGVRVHVRQIRLISSRAWAQEGRVSILASHRLH